VLDLLVVVRVPVHLVMLTPEDVVFARQRLLVLVELFERSDHLFHFRFPLQNSTPIVFNISKKLILLMSILPQHVQFIGRRLTHLPQRLDLLLRHVPFGLILISTYFPLLLLIR